MKKIILTYTLFVLFLNNPWQSIAQEKDDFMSSFEDKAEPDDEAKKRMNLVKETFQGTRLVNFQTVETPGKRILEYRIVHRFNYMGNDPSSIGNYFKSVGDQMLGFDGGASIRMGLEYSHDGRLAVGFGRSSVKKMVDCFAKYKLLEQTKDNKMPVTMTWLSSFNVNTTKDPDKYLFIKSYHRYNYVHQLMIARKMSEKLSIQLAPTFIHYNLVNRPNESNDMYALVGIARYKVSKMVALSCEYGLRLNQYLPEEDQNKYFNSVSVGCDIETGGGHVFQFFVSNSYAIIESQTIPYTEGDITKGQLRIGFNISRAFRM